MANPLPYRVECRPAGAAAVCRSWEPIAAFNVESVAKLYGRDCSRSNRFNVYRVVNTNKRGAARVILESV